MNNSSFAFLTILCYFAVAGNNLIQAAPANSNQSDIIADAGFVYQSNIDYRLYQSNLITNTPASIGVIKFVIRDGGSPGVDADTLPTRLNSITFQIAEVANIRSAALFDGNALLHNQPLFDASMEQISFSGLSGASFTAQDDGWCAITLRCTFDSTVLDNAQIVVSIHSTNTDSAGSQFQSLNAGGASSSTFGDRNRIEVIADRLIYAVQPADGVVQTILSPFEFHAADNYLNADHDANFSVNVSSSGTAMTANNPYQLQNGNLSIYDISFGLPQNQIVMIADQNGTTFISDTFNIDSADWDLGDYRTNPLFTIVNPLTPIYFASCDSMNDVFPWQMWDGSQWLDMKNSANEAPENLMIKPGTIYINHGANGVNSAVQAGRGSGYRIVTIGKNGILSVNDSIGIQFNPFSSLIVEKNGVLEVTGGLLMDSSSILEVMAEGELWLNLDHMNSGHGMWNGIEHFDPESKLVIYDWHDTPTSGSLIDDNSRFSVNANGFHFGELHVLMELSDNYAIVGDGMNLMLCEGDLIVETADTDYLALMNHTEAQVTVGGSIIVKSGNFSFISSMDSGSSQSVVVNGDVIIKQDTTKLLRTSKTIDRANVALKGNLFIDSAALFISDDANAEFHFCGSDVQYIDAVQALQRISIQVDPGASLKQSNHPLRFSGNSSMTVDSGAALNFGFHKGSALYIEQVTGSANRFTSLPNSYLKMTSPDGIWKSTAGIGNVQGIPSSNKSISQLATFHYIGNTDQFSGDGLSTGSSGKVVMIELAHDSLVFRLTNGTGISGSNLVDSMGGKLQINSGTLVGNGSTDFFGSGRLVMRGGKYLIETDGSTVLPQLTGGQMNQYELSGGSIELAADGQQILRGSRTYHHLVFSGMNSGIGSDFKMSTSAIIVDSLLVLKDSCVFDAANKGVFGQGGMVMTGGRFRISKLNSPVPELTGELSPYEFTGGVIELYGSDAASEQLIRGTDFYGNSVIYHTVELRAQSANLNPLESNVNAQASFGVEDELKVFYPTVFRLDESDYVFGPGSFVIDTGATLLYGSPDGIRQSGVSPSDGNIRVSGSRCFPEKAGYGFVGPGKMSAGNALPDTIDRLYFYKGNTSDSVIFEKGHYVSEGISFHSGVGITTDSTLLTLLRGTIASNASESSYIDGPIAKIGDQAFAFPAGDAGVFAPIGISSPGSTDALFVAEYFHKAAPDNMPSAMDSGLDHVSYIEHWILERRQGLPVVDDVNVTLYWMDAQRSVITDLNDLVVAFYDSVDAQWESLGGTASGATGTGGNGSIESAQQFQGSSIISFGSKSGINLLPVDLISFSAEVDALNNVILTWSTATEVDNDYFAIERSSDGVAFLELLRADGKGTSSEINHYVELDHAPISGQSYYRLKQVDLDGRFKYSDLVTVFVDEPAFSLINIYHLSNGDEIVIEIESNDAGPFEIGIYDLSGRVMVDQQMEMGLGMNWHKVDLRKWPPGIYFIKLSSQIKLLAYKLLIVK